jgi:16S rRNA (cytosine1402-N4)-methyltransferase
LGRDMEYAHTTVLLHETVSMLQIRESGTYIDATLGGGGHFSEILRQLGANGVLIGVDQDIEAIENAKQRFKNPLPKIIFVHDNFKNIGNIIETTGIKALDGAIMDLGVSSYQLDNQERGFSYTKDARLDMRMDTRAAKTAYDVVNTYAEEELAKIIFTYGEERYARRIAANIVKRREKKPIETTLELAELIKSSMPKTSKKGGHHPAKRTFQAIRIEVNDELSILNQTIETIFNALCSGGRICIITFHSLEDRIVKNTFSKLAQGCICPPRTPVCVCGNTPKAKIITRKPILPSEGEIERNPRARSAKLRVIEKI